MGEEAIAFCIVFFPIMKQLGYDAKVTVFTTYVATQIRFATSWMNPFSIAIAQSIAEIPVFSGAGFRMVAWLVFTSFGLVFTMSKVILGCTCSKIDSATGFTKINPSIK